jgi:site-specific recombinase XerD
MSGPRDLTPREARDMFLDKRRTGSTELTVQTYYYRLTEFVRWCDKAEIDRITDLSGWDIDRFEAARRSGDRAPTTIRGSMVALKQLLEYCARIGAVDHDLPEKVDPPTLSKAEMTDDTKLSEGDATAFLNFYRESPRPSERISTRSWRCCGVPGRDSVASVRSISVITVPKSGIWISVTDPVRGRR